MDFFTLIGVIVIAVALLACVATETYFGAAAIVALAAAYGVFTYGFLPTFQYAMANLPFLLTFAAIFLACGLVWSFFKWDRFVASQAKAGREQPDWTDNKGRITGWMLWWPFSMVSYVIGDLLADIIRWVQNLFGGIYQRIAARHYPVTRKDGR